MTDYPTNPLDALDADGAFEIGGGDFQFGQLLDEQAINEITNVPEMNPLNPVETLGEYLEKVPKELLQKFSALFDEDVQDNFDTALGAISAITGSLQPALRAEFPKLLNTFGKFIIGQATWDDVSAVWSTITGILTDLNIESGVFWSQSVAILVSPWVPAAFTDKLADVIAVYFRRTQDKATQQELEDALDALLATDPESDFWKGLLGSTRFVWRVGNLMDVFFKFGQGTKTQADLTSAFEAVLDLVGLASPMPVKDFTQELATRWISDMFAPSSLEGVTGDLQTTLNQIGDIFNGLVVTPINQAVQNVKDWWNGMWNPTQQATTKNEDAFSWLTDMFKQQPASKPANPGSIPTGDPLAQALSDAWDWFSGLMGWQDSTTSDVGSAQSTAEAAQVNSVTALNVADGAQSTADSAQTKATAVETAFNAFKGEVFGKAYSTNTTDYALSNGNHRIPAGLFSASNFDGNGVEFVSGGGLKFLEGGWYLFVISMLLKQSGAWYACSTSLSKKQSGTITAEDLLIEGHAYQQPAFVTPLGFNPVVQCVGLVHLDSGGTYWPAYSYSNGSSGNATVYASGSASGGQTYISATKLK